MYKVIAKIAYSSLARRTARSILVVLMIATSLWGLLLMQGVYEGMTEQMIDNAIRSDTGDLTLYAKGYRQENDINSLIHDVAGIEKVLQADSRVETYVKRIKQDGLIATAHYSRMVKIYGVELEAERINGRLDRYLRDGTYSFGKKGKGVIVGASLAKKLKLAIGKKIILTTQSVDNEVVSISLKVTGVLKTNNMAMDDFGVFIELSQAWTLLNLVDGVSQIAITLNDKSNIASVQESLRRELFELDVFRWDEIYPALMQSRVMMEIFSYVMYLLVFCVATLGIFGVILVSVLERTREFGMMIAIGTKFSLICQIVLVESIVLGVTGFVLGSLLGGGCLYYFMINGLDLGSFSAGLEEFGMDNIIYAVIKTSYFFTAFLAVLSATLLNVIFPLRVLKKSRPIEAIQHN